MVTNVKKFHSFVKILMSKMENAHHALVLGWTWRMENALMPTATGLMEIYAQLATITLSIINKKKYANLMIQTVRIFRYLTAYNASLNSLLAQIKFVKLYQSTAKLLPLLALVPLARLISNSSTTNVLKKLIFLIVLR